MPIGSSRGERPTLSFRFAQRAAARPGTHGPDFGLYQSSGWQSRKLSDVATQLSAAVSKALGSGQIELVSTRHSKWASITFTGARHELRFAVKGDATDPCLQKKINALSDDHLPIRGHIVAEIYASMDVSGAGEAMIKVEALTVDAS